MKQLFKRSIIATFIITLSACSTMQGVNKKDALSAECLATAAWGGVLGAVVSGRNDAVKGVIAGASAGMLACLLAKSQVRQTKTAAQVEQNVRAQNRGQLPAEPSAHNYILSVSPGPRLNRDGLAKIHSTVEIVNGSRITANQVREEIILTAPDGQQKTIARDEFKEHTGGFEKVTELKLNPNLLEGLYDIKTNLYINNKLSSSRSTSLELVHNDVNDTYLALHTP